MFNSERLYNVSFQITCFTAESPMFALLATLGQIKESRFHFEAISDDKWREMEHVLISIGLNLVHVEKEPYILESTPTPEEEEEIDVEDLRGDQKFGVLLDELMKRRDDIYKVAADEKTTPKEREAAIKMNARDYNATSAALLKELKEQIIEELLNGEYDG